MSFELHTALTKLGERSPQRLTLTRTCSTTLILLTEYSNFTSTFNRNNNLISVYLRLSVEKKIYNYFSFSLNYKTRFSEERLISFILLFIHFYKNAVSLKAHSFRAKNMYVQLGVQKWHSPESSFQYKLTF